MKKQMFSIKNKENEFVVYQRGIVGSISFKTEKQATNFIKEMNTIIKKDLTKKFPYEMNFFEKIKTFLFKK